MDTRKWKSVAVDIENYKIITAMGEKGFRRPGSMIAKIVDDDLILFYQKGSSPTDLNPKVTIVSEEPAFLKASPLRRVNIEPPISAETHTQIVHTVDMELLCQLHYRKRLLDFLLKIQCIRTLHQITPMIIV